MGYKNKRCIDSSESVHRDKLYSDIKYCLDRSSLSVESKRFIIGLHYHVLNKYLRSK
jgi:hypothetical protein